MESQRGFGESIFDDLALMEEVISDYFAFEAAARGPEDPDEGDRITPAWMVLRRV